MPRPKNITPSEKRTVSLPIELWEFIDSLDIDPIRGAPRYGSQTRYLTRIIRQDMDRFLSVSRLADNFEPDSDPDGDLNNE